MNEEKPRRENPQHPHKSLQEWRLCAECVEWKRRREAASMSEIESIFSELLAAMERVRKFVRPGDNALSMLEQRILQNLRESKARAEYIEAKYEALNAQALDADHNYFLRSSNGPDGNTNPEIVKVMISNHEELLKTLGDAPVLTNEMARLKGLLADKGITYSPMEAQALVEEGMARLIASESELDRR
jgi:hypothetical protein